MKYVNTVKLLQNCVQSKTWNEINKINLTNINKISYFVFCIIKINKIKQVIVFENDYSFMK